MANKIPVKAIFTNSNVTSLGEYTSGDTISTTYTDAKVFSVGGVEGAVSNAQLAAAITSSGLLTTSNVAEGANLYYTTNRANSAIDNRVTKSFIDNLNVDADTLDNQDGSYYLDWTNTTNKPDPVVNVTMTGDVTGAAEATLSDLTSNTITINTTIAPNSVALGTDTTGAYVSNLVPGTGVSITGLGNEGTTPTISIGQSVATNSDVTFANVTVTGNLLVQGNAVQFTANNLVVSDPLIQMGANPVGDALDLGFFAHYIGGSPSIERHAGLFRDATDGQFKLFTNLDPEPTTIVDTANASYQSANLVVNFVVGKVTDISNHSTTNLSEGTNLYFTNARVYANVESIGYASNSYVNTRLSTKANVADLTTSNVSEGSNLYFTNTRAIGSLTGGSGITIGSNGLITSTVSGGVTSVGGATGAVSNAQLASGISSSGILTTANVTEVTNLYFTNTRAVGALTAGSNMSIAANGLLTATVAAGGGGGGGDFNTNINNVIYTGNISTGADLEFTAPSTSGLRYIVRSIYITNVSSNILANVSGTFDGSTYSSNINFANTIPVPATSSVELLKKPKVLQPSDKIYLTSSNTDSLSGIITYECQLSSAYFGAGVDVANANTYANLHTATANSVVESILLANDDPVNDVRVNVVVTNGALSILGYFAHQLVVPADSTIELLEAPKFLENGHRVRVLSGLGNRIEAIISGKTV